jgi:hypothetical protein
VPSAASFGGPGVLSLRPHGLHINDRPSAPLPGAFVCAGSLFGPAAAFRDVPYDPHIAFHGEEIAYSVRLWTHGWDIFVPNDAFMYHDYDTARPQVSEFRRDWDDIGRRAQARIRHLLGIESSGDAGVLAEIGRYGLGRARSLGEYQAFADLDFAAGSIGTRAADGRFPPPASEASRRLQRHLRQAYLHGPHESIETRCGDASRLFRTRYLREQLAAWLKETGVRRLIDAGCGDLQWMQRVDLGQLDWYVGYDIVPELIQANQALFGHRRGHLFGVADIAHARFAPADAILCRRVLNAMPLEDALRALRNLVGSGSAYLLATTHPGAANEDESEGRFRALDLCAPPFGLPPPLRLITDYRDESLPVPQSCLGIWQLGPAR